MVHIQTNTLPEALQTAACRFSQNLAIVSENARLSYEDIQAFSEQFAAYLGELDIKEGDRVAVLVPTSWQFVVAACGIILGGITFLPLDPEIGVDTFVHLLENCPISALVVDKRILSRFPSVVARLESLPLIVCDSSKSHLEQSETGSFESTVTGNKTLCLNREKQSAEALVSITFTSGSTGIPKGVMHSHRSWLCGALATSEYLGIGVGDSILIGLPLAHAYSFRHMLAYLLSGGTMILARDFLGALKMLDSQSPQAMLLVPSAINILLRQFSDRLLKAATHLKFISIGTAAMEDEQLEQIREHAPGAAIHLPYGLTEARVGFLELTRPRSIKHICRGIDLSLKNSSGGLCQIGETGEIVIQGDGLMIGYFGQNAEQFEGYKLNGFATGDMGRLEPDGLISLMGRLDDMVNIGGKKVSPIEIESLLGAHPRVVESAVFGVHDSSGLMGQQLVAIVVPENGASLSKEELFEYLQQHLEQYKIPSMIRLEESLPRNSTGKVLKSKLRELVETKSR